LNAVIRSGCAAVCQAGTVSRVPPRLGGLAEALAAPRLLDPELYETAELFFG
jgi:hypothetical protein